MKKSYIIGYAATAILFGSGIGSFISHYIERPVSVKVRDLNGDKRDDIIIKTGQLHPSFYVFMQQEDGTYTPLNKFGENLKEQEKGKIKSIEEQVKSIQKKADELK